MIKKFNEFLNENKSLSNNDKEWILDQMNDTTPYVEEEYDDYDDMVSYWMKGNKILFECGEDYANADGTVHISIDTVFWNKIKKLGYTDQEVENILTDIFSEKFKNAKVGVSKHLVNPNVDISSLEERDENDVFKWVDDDPRGKSKEEIEQYLLNGKINIREYISMFGTSNKDILIKYFTNKYNHSEIELKKYIFYLKKYDLGDPDISILLKDYVSRGLSLNEFKILLQKYNLEFPTEQINNYYEEITKDYQNGKLKLEQYLSICVKLGFKTPPKEEIKKLFLAGEFDFEIYLFLCKWKGFDTYPTKEELKKLCLEKPGDEYTLRKYIMRFKFEVTKEERYNYYKKNFFGGHISYDDFMNYQIVKMFIDDETKDVAYSFYITKKIK